MEQPPGSLDDLQPQDLSTSGLSAVIDLTRKEGEERVLNNASLGALRMVKSAGWYPDPGATANNPGLQYPETGSSDAAQIQPDNALSHTTVTLSYVSRSHVFPTHDSLSRSPLYSLPPISKFSLRPACDADKGLGDGGFALSQGYLEEAGTPVDLAVQTELPRSLPRECPAQEFPEVNGRVASADGRVGKHVRGEGERVTCLANDGAFENGQGDSWSSSGVCADSSPETLTPVAGEEEEEEEVLFLMSKKGGPGGASESAAAGDLCTISREYVSPLEEPVSPSATSLDDAEDLFVLPRASCSPGGDRSLPEEAACDGSSTEGDAALGSGTDEGAARSENKLRARKRKALLEPLIDLTDDVCLSDISESNCKNAVPHVNGNAKTLDRTLKERKLPVRVGRGTRLEAIVMNINSSKYKVSGCIRSSKKPNASRTTSIDSSLSSPKRKDVPSAGKQKGKDKASLSVQTAELKRTQRGQTNHISTCKGSTSDSEVVNNAKKSQSSPTPKSPPLAANTRSKGDAPPVAPPRTSPPRPKRKPQSRPSPPSEAGLLPSEEIHPARLSPPPPLSPNSPKKSQGKAKSKSPCSKASPTAKTKAPRTPKRRRKKQKQSCSPSMFSPKEPEIKLRYVNYKEEKRDPRLDSFSPFVRVERRQATPSLYTVVNYPDEVKVAPGRGQQQQQQGYVSAAVPSTSCLRPGRVSMHSQHQRALVCCICGRPANAMDLGDLHGPYYPEGRRAGAKAPAGAPGIREGEEEEEEEDCSDSDSSSYSVRGRGRKRAAPPAPWMLRPGAPLKQKALLAENHRRDGGGAGSPAAKRARSSDPASSSAEDWYSAPVLPLEPCEYWLHEDCAIWSAGVFLVKGRVYGLEEAVKVAQETVCSACHDPGATLGCFFKGCPNKYHYRCALEADCVLIEENFSMKCKKHKNKTFKGLPGKRPNVR